MSLHSFPHIATDIVVQKHIDIVTLSLVEVKDLLFFRRKEFWSLDLVRLEEIKNEMTEGWEESAWMKVRSERPKKDKKEGREDK